MDFLGIPCPVCSRTFREEDDIVVCPKCGAPYHRECYQEKGKCVFNDLHKNNESWEYVPPQEKNEPDDNFRYCVRCGEKNPANAIVCKKCGSFMSHNLGDTYQPDITGNTAGGQSSPEGAPFTIFLDPMGGVSPEEDFDGVTGAELAKYVGSNTSYYMPVFMENKKGGMGKFNFCACFFTCAWYLYRKQYLKGTIIAILYLILEISSTVITLYYSTPLGNEASKHFNEDSVYPFEYVSWIWNNKSPGQAILFMMPYILGTLLIGMRVLCGIFGNRSYYKNSVAKVKAIKNNKDLSSEKINETIKRSGGVNTAIAWTCVVCYLILQFAPTVIQNLL